MDSATQAKAPKFLSGGGDAGQLMRSKDWRATPLGDPTGRPAELATLVGVMLGSSQAMFVAWGPSRCWLYNDAYSIFLGNKHPTAMGRPGAEVWPEIYYDTLEPMIDAVFAGGSVHMEDIALPLNRGRGVEDAHFSFSYSPARGFGGEVEGLFCACAETTERIQAERTTTRAAAALEASESRYRGLFESMGEGLRH